MRPPDSLFHYGPPDQPGHFDAGIRNACECINASWWLRTAESCEGHVDNELWPDPMIRFVCRSRYVGYLLFLLKSASESAPHSYPAIYCGYAPDDEWSDVLTYIKGGDSLETRRGVYLALAEAANTNPPADGRWITDVEDGVRDVEVPTEVMDEMRRRWIARFVR